MGWTAEAVKGFFLFITMSVLALGPAQPPIHLVLGALSPGIRQLEHEANCSPPYSP